MNALVLSQHSGKDGRSLGGTVGTLVQARVPDHPAADADQAQDRGNHAPVAGRCEYCRDRSDLRVFQPERIYAPVQGHRGHAAAGLPGVGVRLTGKIPFTVLVGGLPRLFYVINRDLCHNQNPIVLCCSMVFDDLLGKNMTQETQETPLETALRLAINDPGCRPDFYKMLLEAKVFIIQHTEHPGEGKSIAEAGESIAIQHWTRDDETPVIPFFSSLEALQRAVTEEVTYMELPARELFEITKGADLVLNPFGYGKEFFAYEIESLLLDGVNRAEEQRTMEKSAGVLLGQPAEYPQKMVNALVSLFSRRDNVKAAYLVMMFDPSHDDKSHLVVGIDADNAIESIIHEAGTVAADTSPDGQSVDLYRIDLNDDGLSQHFIHKVTPFYTRKDSANHQQGGLLSKLRALLRN